MTPDEQLDRLVLAWQERQAQGEEVRVADLCRDCPQLAPELHKRIQSLRLANGAAPLGPVSTLSVTAPAASGTPPGNRQTKEDEATQAPAGFKRVVTLCEAFPGEWTPGSASLLGAYLERVADNARPTLLRNLLPIEIELRRAGGEQPRVEEYLERFPQFASLVRETFLTLSSVSPDASRQTTLPKSAPGRVPAACRLGEYRLLGELGQGGMGVVYEAVHLRRGHRVALKTLQAVGGAALHRFKREFRALADLNHPNLVGLHTLEADGNHWFFTMDLVEGEDFLTHVRPAGALDEARLRSTLAQLATGVMALHARHVIHRDLKPSNVLVTPEGRVVLLDFGLVAELDGAGVAVSWESVVGTPKYMAPEQAGGGEVTPASDWYALGVMLYEALCGQPPFAGTLLSVLQDKQRRDPPPLPPGGDRPEDLAALALRLLARDPRRRPDAFEVARAVAAAGPAAPAGPQAGHPLVGRRHQLAALQDSYATLRRQGEPVTVFISGRSGEGKTALAEHFLAPLRADRRPAVMSGRCYDRESVPFKALDTLIDALGGYLRSLPEADAALLVPDDVGSLVRVFPVLQRVGVVAKAADPRRAGMDEQQVRQRAFRALRSLLTRIGRRSPVVWFIDDLQWGDADSALALFEVLRPPEAPAVLFLGSFRSDETEGSPFLATWKELQARHAVAFADRAVRVGPLTADECVELVVALLGADDEGVRRRAAEFAQETRGNPFLLTELVGCFDPDTGSFAPVPLREVLARKLGRLPAEAARLLDVVAVSGQALPPEEAAQAAGHERPPVATLLRMRTERLVRLVGPEDRPLIDTYHDRVRETVLADMEEGLRKALHAALGEVIERASGGVADEQAEALQGGESGGDPGGAAPRAHDLAYHFDAAGQRRKAWVYGLLAAEQARRQFALGDAVEQYAVARRNAGETADAVRYRIALGRGEALVLLGRYDEATTELDAATALTGDPFAKATVEGYQGEIALKRGRAGQSAALLECALRRLGNWVPRSTLGWAWALVREPLVHCLHRLFPKRLHAAAPSARGDLTGRLLVRLAQAYSMGNSLKAMWSVSAAMNHAERLPPSPALAFSYAGYGWGLLMAGRFSRAAHYVDRSVELRRRFNDLLGLANSFTAHGGVLYAQARYRDAVAKLDEAVDLYRKTGDFWEINANRLLWALCQDKLGNVAAVVELARTLFATDVRLGDDNSGHYALFAWSLAAQGNLPFEELQGHFRPLPDNVQATSLLLVGKGHRHWFHGRTGEAVRAFEEAYGLVKRNAVFNKLTVATLPWLVTALRRHAESLVPTDARQAQRLRGRAFRLAKWAARLTRLFPPHHPHALRELSHAYAAGGKLRRAASLAERSCAVAEGQAARYEYAESLLLRGRLAQQLGLPGAEEQVRTAEAALAAHAEAIAAAARPAAGQ
jgi:serine/threonine protein kinase/tetratricopeptide (TPR) repeat protein